MTKLHLVSLYDCFIYLIQQVFFLGGGQQTDWLVSLKGRMRSEKFKSKHPVYTVQGEKQKKKKKQSEDSVEQKESL